MQAFQDHIQWQSVKDVCRQLRESGFQALLAGGCVRDLLMKREPHDFDIATNATPDQVEAIFPRSLTVGKAFGVMILPYDGYQLEVATFRVDLEYKDGRRPEGVKFATAEEDAKRRDFTVNALFYNIESGQTLDYVDGQKDIHDRILRTVGRPNERFTEDKLRLLRAVRFAAQLDFTIEKETLSAVIAMAPQVSVVSRERIRDEIVKLLKAEKRVKGLRLLLETGLLSAALPEASPILLEQKESWIQSFEIASSVNSQSRVPLGLSPDHSLDQSSGLPLNFSGFSSNEKVEAWICLLFAPVFFQEGERFVKDKCLKNLKLDNKSIDNVIFALKNVNDFQNPWSLRRGLLIEKLSHPSARVARFVSEVLWQTKQLTGQLTGQSTRQSSDHAKDQSTRTKVRSYLEQNVLLDGLPQSLITGEDVKALGIKPGKVMGDILREAYLLQLEGQASQSPDPEGQSTPDQQGKSPIKTREDALRWLSQLKLES